MWGASPGVPTSTLGTPLETGRWARELRVGRTDDLDSSGISDWEQKIKLVNQDLVLGLEHMAEKFQFVKNRKLGITLNIWEKIRTGK